MSSDPSALAALATVTKVPLRYFEVVTWCAGTSEQQVILAIGKHAMYVVRRSLGGLYPDDQRGEIFYAYLKQLVEDDDTDMDLLLWLSDVGARVWGTDKLYIKSENRHVLCTRIQVAWATDYIFRFSLVGELQRTKHSLRRPKSAHAHAHAEVHTWADSIKVSNEGYEFFIADTFQDQDNSSGGSSGSYVDPARELELTIKVNEAVPIDDLEASNNEHIRWNAIDYKQSVTEKMKRVVLIKNCFHHKRMNLSNDLSSWTGWEIALKSDSIVMVVVLLRRQYIPPTMDAVQDIIVTLQCPRYMLTEGRVHEEDLLHEACLIADSCSAAVHNCTLPQTIYRDIVQAKLDALHFSEESMSWIEKSIGLKPHCEREARIFLKSILHILAEENALSSPDMVNLVGKDVELILDPFQVARLMDKTIHGDSAAREEFALNDPVANNWQARIAKYFSYCLDGVLLSGQFNLYDLTHVFVHTPLSKQRIFDSILFLLHARPKDLTLPWQPTLLQHLVIHPGFFRDYEWNDRVMQSLLELGWIEKQFSKSDGEASGTMSLEYTKFLSQLLISDNASANLKAAICRLFISASSGPIHLNVVVPAVMATIEQRSIYLKTYGTVTLVNLTGHHELVIDSIIEMNAPLLCVNHLKLRDDDLIHYTLSLLLTISKAPHHRQVLTLCGVVEALVLLLMSMPAVPSKHQLLAELSSVIAQICNDATILSEMCDDQYDVVPRLLEVLMVAPLGSRLRSKVMLALRQFAFRAKGGSGFRTVIGEHIPALVEELRGMVERNAFELDGQGLDSQTLECATSSVVLLSALSISRDNCQTMRDVGFDAVLSKLMISQLAKLDTTRERLDQLWQSLHPSL